VEDLAEGDEEALVVALQGGLVGVASVQIVDRKNHTILQYHAIIKNVQNADQ
jgi:hypothetical protein